MKAQAALLLVCLGCALQVDAHVTSSAKPLIPETSTGEPLDVLEPVSNLASPRELLLKKFEDLNKEVENERMQEEIGKTLKAEADKSTSTPSPGELISVLLKKNKDGVELNELLEDNSTVKNKENDDADDDDDDDDEEDDYYYDTDGSFDDNDDDSDDEEDEEKIIANCPKSCKCVRGYQSVTGKCDTLDSSQLFSRGIIHLEVTGTITEPKKLNLGPYALHSFGLQQLESVKFADVHFTKFDRTVFDGLPGLYTVNMTRTSLQTLDPDLFQNCTQLNILAISGHNFKYNQKSKTKEYLLNARSLNEIVFTNNSLTKLPRLAFAKMPELVYINLKDNQLTSLDRVTFKTLESLGELDVSNNELSYFTPKFFEGLDELRTLRIAGNKFMSLRSIISDRLTVLDASGNMITHITKDDLLGVPSVDQLSLKSNGINKIHQHAFTNLDQLTFLDLSENSITSITETHFKSNPRLQILLLSNNQNLQSLPVFRTNTEEHGTFSIYRFECSKCGLKFLEDKTFDAMPALTRLDLSKNALTTIPKNLFSKLQSLRDLNLSDNLISELDTTMFFGAVSLTKLSLAGNFLKTLQVAPFLMTPSLFRLDVSNNILERVWSEAREPLKSLRSLSVRGNQLKRYTVEELKATPKLSGLNMNENPFLCDKDFRDTIEYLTKYGIIPKQPLFSSDDFSFTHESISQWSELAKNVCQFMSEGPPSRTPENFPSVDLKTSTQSPDDTKNDSMYDSDDYDDEDDEDESDNSNPMFYDPEPSDGDNIPFTSANGGDYQEEEVFFNKISYEYKSWYSGILWPVIITVFVTLVVFWVVAAFMYVSKRKRNGPVLRPPMILRQGFNDNKNCGLVYKPLQEEIATPHMPKRGSFYSSSTFHYDKIVPESV